jgi:hypothetical protein
LELIQIIQDMTQFASDDRLQPLSAVISRLEGIFPDSVNIVDLQEGLPATIFPLKNTAFIENKIPIYPKTIHEEKNATKQISVQKENIDGSKYFKQKAIKDYRHMENSQSMKLFLIIILTLSILAIGFSIWLSSVCPNCVHL